MQIVVSRVTTISKALISLARLAHVKFNAANFYWLIAMLY